MDTPPNTPPPNRGEGDFWPFIIVLTVLAIVSLLFNEPDCYDDEEDERCLRGAIVNAIA